MKKNLRQLPGQTVEISEQKLANMKKLSTFATSLKRSSTMKADASTGNNPNKLGLGKADSPMNSVSDFIPSKISQVPNPF